MSVGGEREEKEILTPGPKGRNNTIMCSALAAPLSPDDILLLPALAAACPSAGEAVRLPSRPRPAAPPAPPPAVATWGPGTSSLAAQHERRIQRGCL